MSSLERGDIQVLFFRASCELGFAVKKNRNALYAALWEVKGGPLYDHLLAKSRQWIDIHWEKAAEVDYAAYIKIVGDQIRADAAGSRAQLASVYDRIFADLQSRSPATLHADLASICSQAYEQVDWMIKEFGGKEAVMRWDECCRAELVFDHNEPGPTRCSFQSGTPDSVTVHIGEPRDSDTDAQKKALSELFSISRFFSFMSTCRIHTLGGIRPTRYSRKDFL
jgi:hypothetical protein